MTLYVFFTFLHVLAAMLAFGTAILAFPVIGAFGEKEPGHLSFAWRLNYALGRRAVTPLAITTFALGIILTILGDWDIGQNEWLAISIVLFLITVIDAQLITLPTVRRVADLTASGGETEQVARLVRRIRVGGSFSALLLVVITMLMVWKPGA